MFSASGARSVGRSELRSPASSRSSSPDPALTKLLRSRVNGEFSFIASNGDAIDEDPTGAASEDEVELRLFAAPSEAAQSHKIRLSSPDAESGEPGFLVKKPQSYYFAEEMTSEDAAKLRAAAVSGETVVRMSRESWPGCALPWKVRTISAAGIRKDVLVGHPPTLVQLEENTHRRRRKGKKSRIALRKKVEVAKLKEAERTRLVQEKEETEKEKRTRRNREKKVKKKARDKAKKSAEAGAANSAVEDPDSED